MAETKSKPKEPKVPKPGDPNFIQVGGDKPEPESKLTTHPSSTPLTPKRSPCAESALLRQAHKQKVTEILLQTGAILLVVGVTYLITRIGRSGGEGGGESG